MKQLGRVRRLAVGLGVAGVLFAACAGGSDDDVTAPPTPVPTSEPTVAPTTTATPVPVTPLAINHIQVLGSHNSYHLRPQQVMFDAIAVLSVELAESIEYSHASLTDQLETFGIRQFEIDVYADPGGGLYSSPAANALVGLDDSDAPLLSEPGFKVLHTPDFDYSTTCLTLIACLGEIDAWSTAHPNHLPIMIMLEFKAESVPEAAAAADIEIGIPLDWTIPPEPTPELLDELDAEIRSVFGPGRLIAPDDVRGDAATLEEAVLQAGWPSLAQSRGKVMFSMTDGGAIRDMYVAEAPSLEGRVIFTNGTPGRPDAAFMRFDDPADPGLEAAVAAGYLVRTRTDSPTADARNNDPTRRDFALGGGAHFLSTDYYVPSEFFDSPYEVALPGGVIARCNPVSAPDTCTDDQLAE